jgi:oligopeptide transport system substrate-binding protein
MRFVIALLLALATAACSGGRDDGIVDVAFISGSDELNPDGLRLDSAGQHVRAATTQGLVELDASGAVVPAIAERWIVTDDGSSYIFRIHEYDLERGQRLTAQEVRDSLKRTLRKLDGTTLGLDLAKVRDIRAMTGRVIEIRLSSPMPDLLQVLAQPELGLVVGNQLLGPMRQQEDGKAIVLKAMPPEARGLPSQPDWADAVSDIRVYAADAAQATKGFGEGRYDLVLGGRIETLPMADLGPLTRGTIRLDPALGLFGLDVRKPTDFLGTAENREALAMAIDRNNLLQAFNLGGWTPTTRIVAPGLPGDNGTVSERWSDLNLAQRQAQARSRVAQWRAGKGPPKVSIGLPEGPGSDLLFAALAKDFATIGVSASRAGDPKAADLVLRDRVARFGAATWFLDQFNCRVSQVVCTQGADYLVAQANTAQSPAAAASYLAEAEQALTATNLFIPLGAPIRWSLVRGDINEFIENRWNIHPLFPLSRAPI